MPPPMMRNLHCVLLDTSDPPGKGDPESLPKKPH